MNQTSFNVNGQIPKVFTKKPKNNFKFLLYNFEVIFKFAVDLGDQTVKEELIQVIADG